VRERLGLVGLGAAVIRSRGLCRGHGEQSARLRNIVGARAAGEQAIVADAVEAVRQKTGRPVALSCWLCRPPQRPTARAV
jgi:hypothetical protein